jgi:hypothetical protein
VRRLLIAVAAAASAAFVAMPPANAFPFKMDTNSIAYWLNTLRFSRDPTFNNRIHSLFDCGPSFQNDDGGVYSCKGYIDISDGTYRNGTSCLMKVNMYYDSQTAIKEKVSIGFDNEFCYRGSAASGALGNYYLHWQ